VDVTFGAKHEEAVLAVYSASIGVLGGSIEVVGLTMKGSAEHARKVLLVPATGGGAISLIADAGRALARFGGILGAVSGFVDAIASFRAAGRAAAGGGISAQSWYIGSSVSYAISATFMSYALYSGSTAILSAGWILGPVGWAVLAGVVAYAFWKFGEEAESSPLERWSYYSYFGMAKDHKFSDANSAVAALNAAVIGVDVYLVFDSDVRVSHYEGMAAAMGGMEAGLAVIPRLKYQIVIPRYDSSRAAYKWQLTVYRYSGEQVLASGVHPNVGPKPGELRPRLKRLDYVLDSTNPTIGERVITTADGDQTNFLIVHGNIELSIANDIDTARVFVEYLPNAHDAEMMALTELLEVK